MSQPASAQKALSTQPHGRVLIVASTDANQSRWSAELERIGYKTTAAGAAEALRVLELAEERFSAVLLDAGLPRRTTEDVLSRLGEGRQLEDLAVVIVGR